MNYREWIQWLETVPSYGKKDGVHNMERLMKKLGNPQDELTVIHVAGTNGKGSCCAMLAQILQQSGYQTGLYVSPHLIEYTERIQMNGCQIEKEEMVSLGLEVKEAIDAIVAEGGNHATFFEILTAIAFIYFARRKADVVLLETGVGGRLDATNVVKKPELCLITSISLDHTKVLGTTLPQIASEKAGIIKEGTPVVLAENEPSVQAVIGKKAEEMNSPIYYSGWVQAKGNRYHSGRFSYEDLKPSLIGDYQTQNISAVLYAAFLLQEKGWRISEQSLRRGLAETRWPGRMEKRSFQGKRLLLEGAHNPAGAGMLAQYLDRRYPASSCQLLFSALAKKDVRGILLPLQDCQAIRDVIFTTIEGENQMEEFCTIWNKGRQAAKPVQCVEGVRRALETGAKETETELLVCAGSLYLVGEIEAVLEAEKE